MKTHDQIIKEFIIELLRLMQVREGCTHVLTNSICDCEINGADLTAELCSILIELQEQNK